MELTSRQDFMQLPDMNFREIQKRSNKIIVLSCEGSVTEETYFDVIKQLFSEIKSKIQVVSVLDDIRNKERKERTKEEENLLKQSRPDQLIRKMDAFKTENEQKYNFALHEEDEFWIVTDVDNNTNKEKNSYTGVSNKEKWEQVLEDCEKKSYNLAISNPFFELWLLLHHDDVQEDDYQFAVTENHAYEPTKHFRERLQKNDAKLIKNGKKVRKKDYNIIKVKQAIERAKTLHNQELDACKSDEERELSEKWPHTLGSTVYRLLDNIINLYDESLK